MYVAHYGFKGRPFQLVPDPRFFFASRAHREALADLVRALSAAEGLMLLVGPVGVGKTMLVDYLLAELGSAHFKIGRLALRRAMSESLGPAILESFGEPPHKGSARAWRRRLARFLKARAKARRRVLLVIDEAQNLEPAGLEELRALIVEDLGLDGVASIVTDGAIAGLYH
ncbi:MAG: AAA family ATPase, partial [Geminicoccaceae bacterium]|nr:AAA family ATPase [Geminicoccaceae bacterium]